VPTLPELSPTTWAPYDAAGLDWRWDEQLSLLRRLSRWTDELADFPDDEPHVGGKYFYNNSAFGRTDASVYYAIIRELQPRHVLEVGGGYSTLLSTQAAIRNGSTVVDCIEPFPIPDLSGDLPGLGRLIERKVQEVPLEEFERLQAGDILFIDSSHVSRIGSDVNYLVLRVLPRLHDGVLVHIHDIFLPDEYPESWIRDLKLFWSEQYLVHAFLLFNSAFQVLLSNHKLGRDAPDKVVEAFPHCQPPGGGSLWLMKGADPRL